IDVNSELADQFEERAAVLLRRFRSLRDVAAEGDQQTLNVGSLELFNHLVLHLLKRLRNGIGQRDVLAVDHRLLSEGGRSYDNAFQFTHIARPIVEAEFEQRVGGETVDVPVIPLRELSQEIRSQQRDVFAAFTQRRQRNRDHIQAIVKV